MQQGMLFHHLKEPHSGIDIEQLVVHLPEAVDPDRMRSAWQWLVNRHDVLRTRFSWERVETPRQEILSDVTLEFVTSTAAELPGTSQSEKLRAFLEGDRLRGFDMDRAPMLRVTLLQWNEKSYSLIWTFHHALLDGRSYPILLREVFEAYQESGSGGIKERSAPFAYRCYIDWLQAQEFSTAESFWKLFLAGFRAPTPLVVDAPAVSPESASRYGEAWCGLDRATTARLREVALAHSVTLNSIVMGAWAILLHRYSGEEDVVFGATRACRKSSTPDADQTVGIFINTVPVRAKLTGNLSALSVVRMLRQDWVEMRAHEHTPLARVKAVSEIPPDQPLFESLLVFENYRLNDAMHAVGNAWKDRQVELHELTSFALTLAAYGGESLQFKFEFDRRRFEDVTITRMLGHLQRILEGIAAHPDTAVSDLTLLSQDEHRELVWEFNRSLAEPRSHHLPIDGGAVLHALFEGQVARQPEAIAITCAGQSLTYAELNARANRLARELVRHGVKPDILVGICLDRSNDLVIAILAVLKAGGAYLPIDLAYPAERLAFILEDAGAPLLLTHSTLTANLPATSATVLCLDEALEKSAAGDESDLLPSAGPDHLAYVIYTSGTTGNPKGSLITHRNVVRLFSCTEHWYGFNQCDVWTLFHSTAFDFSVWEIWGALLYGGRVVVVPFLVSRSPEAFYELLAEEKVTILNQTPSAFRQLIQAEEVIGQKKLALRYVIFGGEALEMQSLRPWFERHGDQQPQLVNMYGITETTVHVTYRPLCINDVRAASVIGAPIPDLQVYILDAQRHPVPLGVPGEMYVGGAGLARGYLKRAELTSERFIGNPFHGTPSERLYRTGDRARFLANRDIEYMGRADDQVKIRGFRIELGEIVSVLCRHSGVRQASVMVRTDGPGSKQLVAYLVPGDPTPEVRELRDHLKKKLPDYMVPAAFVFLDKLPLTTNGKIDRKALPAPEQDRPEFARRYVAPRTPAEEKLAEIWRKVLRLERVGVNDNFFELGGDSILSIQVISLARREDLRLTPKLLFANQTIAELAAAAGAAPAASLMEEVVAGDVPLTPIQRWFFEQNLADMAHYNQAFLFELKERLDRSVLQPAVVELAKQHDALRFRYDAASGRQHYSSDGASEVMSWIDLSHEDAAGQRRRIEEIAATTQTQLDLARGPLWRVVYFDLGASQPGRLLIVIHHLAVDGISWRPLLEDLETACRQIRARQKVELPPKTSSFKTWAERLREYSSGAELQKEASFWRAVSDAQPTAEPLKTLTTHQSSTANTEGSSQTLKLALTVEETRSLLHNVPSAYNTQINDVLLTALARAWHKSIGSRALYTNLEGHGREPLFEDVDLSRSVGWFTSIFPVRLELPDHGSSWQPGEALKAVKEQIRQIPRRGIGYGILRYLTADSGFNMQPEPKIVFNYLGQFDQMLAGSQLFRFAAESTGPWHSPKQRRRHVLEVNSLVINGRLELWWTYAPEMQFGALVPQLAAEFMAALKELLAHCESPAAYGRTASDFPLAGLDQAALDRLLEGRRDVEDIYPLSPIQTLFHSAHPENQLSTFDHWYCTLRGELDLTAFQQAWDETAHRHTVLRSTVHSDGLREPLQIVHRDVRLPWTLQDWRNVPAESQAQSWEDLLRQDSGQPLIMTEPPAMRLTLVRLSSETWKFLWSVPALLLDGWSWPVVFREASYSYESSSLNRPSQLEAVRPYRDYLEWLDRQSTAEAHEFWRTTLSGFSEPTPLPSEAPEQNGSSERFAEHRLHISSESTAALQEAARRLQITLNTLLQAAWALLLCRQSGRADVVFGSAFSGRPADLHGVESIVGPFVNNLPVRVKLDRNIRLAQFCRQLHSQLLELSSFQFTPLMEIQRLSDMPWRHRLFDSLIVFQNYLVDESARRFGGQIEISSFEGPIHTNYPLLLLAEPGSTLRVKLIYDRQAVAPAAVERWGRDLETLLQELPANPDRTVADVQTQLSQPVIEGVRGKRKLTAQSQNIVPPQTEMERKIAAIWQQMFGIENISIEDNFFDLGGHSLLLVQMYHRLRESVTADLSVVTLLEFPTIGSLARHLEPSAGQVGERADQVRERAQRQKQALARLRMKARETAEIKH